MAEAVSMVLVIALFFLLLDCSSLRSERTSLRLEVARLEQSCNDLSRARDDALAIISGWEYRLAASEKIYKELEHLSSNVSAASSDLAMRLQRTSASLLAIGEACDKDAPADERLALITRIIEVLAEESGYVKVDRRRFKLKEFILWDD